MHPKLSAGKRATSTKHEKTCTQQRGRESKVSMHWLNPRVFPDQIKQVGNNFLSLIPELTEWNKEERRPTISFESQLQYFIALIAFSSLLRLKYVS